jgi:(1->4)-alpha-D-glucan 1-alpha-D-glucosylmutase
MLAGAHAIAALPDRAAALRELLEHAQDGRAKFQATWCTLQLRRAHEAMLRRAEYVALEVRGERAGHVVAFARRSGDEWLVVVAARQFASLGLAIGDAPIGAVWGDAEIVWPVAPLPGSSVLTQPWLEDCISGRRHRLEAGVPPVAALLREFPVSALYGVISAGAHAEPRSAGAGAD